MRPWSAPAALLAVFAAIGCQGEDPAPVRGAGAEPEALAPGVLSLPDAHESPSDVLNGDTLYFTRHRLDYSEAVLWRVVESPQGWTEPEALPLGGTMVAGGAFGPGDSVLYFTSDRPVTWLPATDRWNLFAIRRGAQGWDSAVALPEGINGPASECCAVPAADGGLFFASDRAGSWDIYLALPDGQGGFGAPQRLDSTVNSPHGEWPGAVSRDGTILLFSSIRPEGLGGDDIWVSHRTGAQWGPARVLGPPVNTAAFEDNPRLSRDGTVLYWSSHRGRGRDSTGTLYRMPARAAGVDPR